MRRICLALAITGLGLIGAEQAMACSCAPQSTRDALASSDVAVVGKLMDVDPATDFVAKFHYRVRRVFKGPAGLSRGEILTVRSPRQSSACGLPRNKNRRYGLLLDRRNKRLTANLCRVVSPKRLRRAAEGKAKGRICASR